MVSDAKKKKAAAKKVNVLKKIVKNEAAAAKVAEEAENITANGQDTDENGQPIERQMEEMVLSERTCGGILTSHPQSRDIQFENFSLLFHGHELIADTNLELNYGRSVLILYGSGSCFGSLSDLAFLQALRAFRPKWLRQVKPAEGTWQRGDRHSRAH